MNTRMLQLGSLFPHFQLASKAPESVPSQSPKQLPTLPEVLQHVIKLTGLRREDVYNNLRIPDQFQAAKDDINIVILTGQGIFCIDVKPWKGTVSAHNKVWHVQVKEEDQNFTNTCVEQMDDPLKAVTTKTARLCSHLKRSGVAVRSSLFFPRVIFLSPDCWLDEELMKRRELVSHSQIDDFLKSFKAGYMAWITDAVTPSWISGHLSYRQMESVREVLRKVGTWDMVQLHCGEQLKGDYQGCQFIALDRQETDTLEFSRVKTLSADSLWALLGHIPQVTVKMYKRGSHSWLGKSLNATATIPSNTFVMFRISGEEFDAKIPANTIHSITLSV
uniref:NERD domain-containing protein n=1 Tax=Iconisemion striatum TaxID=60296 RepID=A0A1A7WBK9_9TELE